MFREKGSKIVPAGDGEFKVYGGGLVEYVRPKTVKEGQEAMNNYRAALMRLWPWDHTGEVLVRALEDYGWLFYVGQKKGQQKRVILIEKLFEEGIHLLLLHVIVFLFLLM